MKKGARKGKGKEGKRRSLTIDTLTAIENRSENAELMTAASSSISTSPSAAASVKRRTRLQQNRSSLQYNMDHMTRLEAHQSATQAKLRKETVSLLTAIENLRGEHAELPVQERMKRYVYGVFCCVCVVLRVCCAVLCCVYMSLLYRVCSKRASNNVMHRSFPSQVSRGSAATHPPVLHAVPMGPVDGQARVGEHRA